MFGKVYLNFKSVKPFEWQVKSGHNFPYRCYEYSLQNFKVNDLFVDRQLSLF